jgi:hypothetical protein
MKVLEQGRALTRVLLTLVCCLPSGCGNSKIKVYPSRGEVFIDRKPATDATIHFHPVLKNGCPPAFATVEVDGSFELSTYAENDGAAAGDYFVTVNWSDEQKIDGELVSGPDRLGGRYNKPDASGLKATITEGDNDVPRFDLKKN